MFCNFGAIFASTISLTAVAAQIKFLEESVFFPHKKARNRSTSVVTWLSMTSLSQSYTQRPYGPVFRLSIRLSMSGGSVTLFTGNLVTPWEEVLSYFKRTRHLSRKVATENLFPVKKAAKIIYTFECVDVDFLCRVRALLFNAAVQTSVASASRLQNKASHCFHGLK